VSTDRTPYTVVIEQPAEEAPPNGAVTGPTAAPPAAPAASPLAAPAGSPSPGGPRAPHLEAEVEIPEYPGHTARVWVNFPQRLLGEVGSGDEPRQRAALSRILLAHNGWCDEDGEPYPPAGAPEFWAAIPTHLAACVMRAIQQRATAAPLAPSTRGR